MAKLTDEQSKAILQLVEDWYGDGTISAHNNPEVGLDAISKALELAEDITTIIEKE